jgi:hypothetical protein
MDGSDQLEFVNGRLALVSADNEAVSFLADVHIRRSAHRLAPDACEASALPLSYAPRDQSR